MIEFRKAKKDYSNINMDLSLKINKGEIVLLVGKNASGKTSSIKLLLGVNELDYGSVDLDGEKIQKVDKEKFGFVLQDSFFPMVFTPRQISSVLGSSYKKFDTNLFYEYLARFGLPSRDKIKTYSNGMLAKLKIISAICHDPEIIILDEPTLGLDLLSRDAIINLIRDIMDDDKTIIIASHLTYEFENLCDRVVFIDQGQIIGSFEMDLVDSSLGLIKGDLNIQEDLDKDDILSMEIEDYSVTYLVKNRQKYMDGKFLIEKAGLEDLVRAIYRRRK
jgi:ABC-2 type transport system ATP-binding protein